MAAMSLFSRPFSRSLAAAATAAAFVLLGGCATMSDSPTQQLEVHTVLDYREIGGVGCILSNDAGRWYVVAPGRVTVTRSAQPLSVSCKKGGAGVAAEVVNARSDTANMVGNIIVTAGIGNYIDRQSGAGYGYPGVLTVLLALPEPTAQAQAASPLAARMF